MSEDAQLEPRIRHGVSTEHAGIRFRSMTPSAHTVSGDCDPTMHGLRVVTCDVVRHAEDTLPLVERQGVRGQRAELRELGRTRPTTAVITSATAARPESRGSTAISFVS